MIYQSPYNSITFKTITGSYPNSDNRLHNNRKIAGKKTICYYQPFNNDHIVYLQFYSESDADMTIKGYNPNLSETITVSYDSTYGTKYFFNFIINLDTPYHDQKAYFILSQPSDEMESEPINVYDMSEEIENGEILYFKYTNFDKPNNDIMRGVTDWESIDNDEHYMDFFLSSQNNELNLIDEIENLKGVDKLTTIYSSFFSGNVLKTAPIPDYMIKKILNCSGLDYFEINEIRYLKQSQSSSPYGSSTSSQLELSLIEREAAGVNVDAIGTIYEDMKEYHKPEIKNAATTSYEATEPKGYYTSIVFVEQKGTPATNPVKITLGYGGVGSSDIGTYRIYSGRVEALKIGKRGSLDSESTIYVGIPEIAGNVLKISINYQLQDI